MTIESTYRGYTIEQRYLHYVPGLSLAFKSEEEAQRAIDRLEEEEPCTTQPSSTVSASA